MPPADSTTDWWQPRAAVRRFLQDLLSDELQRQRRQPLPLAGAWPDSLALVEDLGVDSLELLALATAVAEALHLHESGIEDYLLARRTFGDWVEIAQAGLAQFSARLTFRTSGSSGMPKPCVHALATLQQEVAFLARVLPGRRTRVLSAAPAHHIYGFLFTVLLPRHLGIDAASVVDLRGSSPAALARAAQPGDLVVAHPDYWHAAARVLTQLPPDVVGVTSTAPCPDAVAEAVLQCGLAQLVQVYGASETAGIGWRGSHREPYALMAHWEPGLGNTLRRLLPEGGTQHFDCQDHLEWLDARHFRVGPRHDAAVQVGGINVHPHRVREVLRRHPLVEDAVVRLMRPDEGARLKAFVVPRSSAADAADVQAQLRAWIAAQLSTPERPQAITLGPALPRTPQGKPADWPA